jgi:hypothetical protein
MSYNEKPPAPTADEIKEWLLSTTRHCFHVEFYANMFDVGLNDPERPHDIVGKGNKFTPVVISGFSVRKRDDSQAFFDTYVKPSLDMHRRQYHHRMWNQYNPAATEDELYLGAVDAICSLLEDRGYQGGTHSFDEVEKEFRNSKPHQIKFMKNNLKNMRETERPDLDEIKSLHVFPNIGVPEHTYRKIKSRVNDTISMVKKWKGYEL